MREPSLYIHGLRFRPDLNGRECTLLVLGASSGRLRLACDGEILNLKPQNVEDDGGRRARLEKEAEEQLRQQRLSTGAVEAAEQHTSALLLRAGADAVAQDVRLAREAEESRLHSQLLEEEAIRAGFSSEGERCFYELDFLAMRRHYRRDPGYYAAAVASDRLDPTDPDGGFDADGAPYESHPFWDYGFEARLGPGRVLWDELRPALWDAVTRIKPEGIVDFWRRVAAERAMRPVGMGGVYDPVAAMAADLPAAMFESALAPN